MGNEYIYIYIYYFSIDRTTVYFIKEIKTRRENL